MVIFEKSQPGRYAFAQAPSQTVDVSDIPDTFLRKDKPCLPEVSELEAIRHYTKLSTLNFSIDTQFYPLGSCTMKYNPRGVHHIASMPNFLAHHPLTPEDCSQGLLECFYRCQQALASITGLPHVSLSPMAGAQGEFTGVAMIRAYHQAQGDDARNEILIPEAAHGTNPASAILCGYKTKEVPATKNGNVDLDALEKALGPHTAGIMLTNPSTLGVFEQDICTIAKMVHEVGGLLYYDGANLNAILGKARPGDMGFDVLHLNLHKTFATPHGGGGPGCGPVATNEKLAPFLPIPRVCKKQEDNKTIYRFLTKTDCPQSIGRLSAFMGNAGIILRAYIYIQLLGHNGLRQVSELATLNANYLAKKLSLLGYTLAFPERRATHEFIISLTQEKKQYGITAMDVAKRLLDSGIHAPTTYFPLIVPECLLIEPTETESKQTLDNFIQVMADIRHEMEHHPERILQAPKTTPIGRVDEVKAARELNLVWKASTKTESTET